MSNTPESLLKAIRQYRHNDDNSPNVFRPEQGFVNAFDYDVTTEIVTSLEARIAELEGRVWLNVKHPDCHKAADAFWEYWKENGEPHKHGYYESTWGAINAALEIVGVVPDAALREDKR